MGLSFAGMPHPAAKLQVAPSLSLKNKRRTTRNSPRDLAICFNPFATGDPMEPDVISAPNRPTVVFILSEERSGSTWLSLVLGSNSWASSLGEYWRPFLTPRDQGLACPLCLGRGLPDCVVLGGVRSVPKEAAYHFACSRMGSKVLIDASKRLDWCASFVGRKDIDPCIVHLIRHPCGFIESERRRHSRISETDLLARWVNSNRTIENFVAKCRARKVTAFYDDLAEYPEDNFPELCAAFGYSWERGSLRYWEKEHHAFCANGATLLYLNKLPNFSKIGVYTGDDSYYADLAARPTSADRRWEERLSLSVIQEVLQTPYVVELRQIHNREPWKTPNLS